MHIDTGEIKEYGSMEEMKRDFEKGVRMMQIDPDDMTKKQKEEMRVSLYDNRSILGKKRVKSRRERNRNKRDK